MPALPGLVDLATEVEGLGFEVEAAVEATFEGRERAAGRVFPPKAGFLIVEGRAVGVLLLEVATDSNAAVDSWSSPDLTFSRDISTGVEEFDIDSKLLSLLLVFSAEGLLETFIEAKEASLEALTEGSCETC